jgi:hypothetical protein
MVVSEMNRAGSHQADRKKRPLPQEKGAIRAYLEQMFFGRFDRNNHWQPRGIVEDASPPKHTWRQSGARIFSPAKPSEL